MKKTVLFAAVVAAVILLCGCCAKHDLVPATCTEPEKCAECGKVRGVASGHSFLAPTCTAPEVCAVCGEKQGDALGHSYADWVESQAAACTEAGEKSRSCERCGEVQTAKINATGHTETLYCERCGEPTIAVCDLGEWYEFDGISLKVADVKDELDSYGYHHIFVYFALKNNSKEYAQAYSVGLFGQYEKQDAYSNSWRLDPEGSLETYVEWIIKDEDLSVCFMQYPMGRLGALKKDALHWILLPIGAPTGNE